MLELGCTWLAGEAAVQGPLLTVTVAVALFVVPQPVSRTQYDVVEVGATLTEVPVASGMGLAVFGAVPVYH